MLLPGRLILEALVRIAFLLIHFENTRSLLTQLSSSQLRLLLNDRHGTRGIDLFGRQSLERTLGLSQDSSRFGLTRCGPSKGVLPVLQGLTQLGNLRSEDAFCG